MQTNELHGGSAEDKYTIVFDEVISIHIADDLIRDDGQIEIVKLLPVGRIGYQDYPEVIGVTVFTMNRPDLTG